MSEARTVLTEELVPPGTRQRAFRTLLLTLLLVAAANLAILLLRPDHPTNRAHWLVREKWALLLGVERDPEFLVLGDSSGNQGLRPDILGQKLGGTGLNLCTFGDMLAVSDAWMLAQHLERHAPPRRVVVVHVYDAWHRAESTLDRWPIWAVPLEHGFWRRLPPPTEVTPKMEAEVLSWRYLPLLSDYNVLATWLKRPSSFHSPFRREPDGFMPVSQANPANVVSDGEGHKGAARRARPPLSRVNAAALEVIAGLADRHGFDVYLVTSPLWDGLWSDPTFRKRFQATHNELKEAIAGWPRMHLLLETPATFPKAAMENADHVVGDAAAQYTAQVAEAILAAERPR